MKDFSADRKYRAMTVISTYYYGHCFRQIVPSKANFQSNCHFTVAIEMNFGCSAADLERLADRFSN